MQNMANMQWVEKNSKLNGSVGKKENGDVDDVVKAKNIIR